MSVPTRQDLLTDADELANSLGDPQLRILDCRFDLMQPAAGRAAWLEAHIPGAVYADLDKDLSGPVRADTGRHPLPEPERAVETFSRLGIDGGTRVVVYDDSSGAIASRAWWVLRWLGHPEVTVLDGGLQAWRSQDLALDSGVQEVVRRNFVASPGVARVLSSREVGAVASRL